MNSIRSYLALRLLVGFVLLLSIASLLVYLISKKILEDDFDGRLFAKAQAIMVSISQKRERIDIDWDNLPKEFGSKEKRGNLVQVLDSSGRTLTGSTFLSQAVSPIPDQEKYQDIPSPEGEKLRVLTLTFRPHVEEDDEDRIPESARQKCTLLVASEREHLDHSLAKMAGVLAAMTLLTSVLSLGIVSLALRRGLHPLTGLSQDVAAIDVTSLGKKIEIESLPAELVPIVEKLNGLLARLEVSFARERRFSADVSHELRTPVAELRSLSEVMLRQPDLTASQKQAFEDVFDAARQMETMVTTLLEIVRGERSDSVLETGKIILGDLLQASWNSYEAKARARMLHFEFNCPSHLEVKTDARLLRLICNNLLSNAVEYTPTKGTIEIKINESDSGTIVLIQNSTLDVTPEDLPHFFERFWRKDKVRSSSEHTGLGLSLTQVLCQKLQIHLAVTMPKPNLICFQLTIPHSPA